jgi:hypothetical protein
MARCGSRDSGKTHFQLLADDLSGSARFSLGSGLTHADNGPQADFKQGRSFFGYLGAGFALIGSALAVAHKAVLAAEFRQHLGGDFAGMRALDLGGYVLGG